MSSVGKSNAKLQAQQHSHEKGWRAGKQFKQLEKCGMWKKEMLGVVSAVFVMRTHMEKRDEMEGDSKGSEMQCWSPASFHLAFTAFLGEKEH